jgi:hypothetical protein
MLISGNSRNGGGKSKPRPGGKQAVMLTAALTAALAGALLGSYQSRCHIDWGGGVDQFVGLPKERKESSEGRPDLFSVRSLKTHQKYQKLNVQKPNAHVEKPNAHVQKPNAHVQKPNAHVQKPNAHVQKPSAHVHNVVQSVFGAGPHFAIHEFSYEFTSSQ